MRNLRPFVAPAVIGTMGRPADDLASGEPGPGEEALAMLDGVVANSPGCPSRPLVARRTRTVAGR